MQNITMVWRVSIKAPAALLMLTTPCVYQLEFQRAQCTYPLIVITLTFGHGRNCFLSKKPMTFLLFCCLNLLESFYTYWMILLNVCRHKQTSTKNLRSGSVVQMNSIPYCSFRRLKPNLCHVVLPGFSSFSIMPPCLRTGSESGRWQCCFLLLMADSSALFHSATFWLCKRKIRRL